MSGSLLTRAALAVVLMVGFYALALGIAAGLAFIPYAEWVYGHRLHLKVAFLCISGAGVIVWAILPRFDKFEAPGAELTPEAHPKLFQAIAQVAAAAGQAPPAEVYLVRDVNAWVSSRGGWMGIGSRRIMGLGLPLMQHVTVSQLNGVLAHEFGHYLGGDVKLGPWIYKTREAIGRTVALLRQSGSSAIHAPFVWYGRMFLRLTHAISRQQELNADSLSARIVGREAFVSGMKAVHGASAAFDAYWESEVQPIFGAGFRPPLAHGFGQFLSAPEISRKVDDFLAKSLASDETDPYDTHPSTRERIARIEAADLPPPLLPPDERRAIELLGDVAKAELALLKAIAVNPAEMAKLKPIEWERVGADVWLQQWQRMTQDEAKTLRALTPASAPTTRPALEALGRQLMGAEAIRFSADELVMRAASAIAASTSCLLVRAGWQIDAPVGAPVVLRRGEQTAEPFQVMAKLARGEGTADEWAALHAGSAVSDQPLAA